MDCQSFARDSTHSQQPAGDGNHLAYDLSIIVVSKFNVAIEMRRIRMQDKRAIFDTATRAQIGAIPLLKKIDGLLPKGF